MAAVSVSRISCCQLRPPAPSREGGGATTANPMVRRACFAAAAACVVAGATTGLFVDGGGGAAIAGEMARGGAPHVDAVVVAQRAPVVVRWSDRRQCPPWHANTLENIVPENLPRPYARRRFNGITAGQRAPALDGSGSGAGPAASTASPDAVVPFLALRSAMGCFSL